MDVVIHKTNPNSPPQGTALGSFGKPFAAQEAIGQPQSRNINAASSTYAEATNSATWLNGVSHMEIQALVTTTNGGIQNNQACLVVYDAPNAAVAAAWLADTGSASSDVVYDMVFPGQTLVRDFRRPTGEPWFVKRIDVLPIGTGNTVMRVLVGAC